jgi:hypothetical protein
MVVNSSWHASTNTSPALMFFGREIRTATKMLLPSVPLPMVKEGEYPGLLQNRMQYIWNKAREYLQQSKEAQKYYYDQNVVVANLDVGDRVYQYNPRGKPGLATKLLHHWIGPYVVTRVNETNAWIRPVSQPFVESKCVHLNLLKKYSGTNIIPEETAVFSDSEDEQENSMRDDEGEKQEEEEQLEEILGQTDADLAEQEVEQENVMEQERGEEMVRERGLRRRPAKRLDPNFEYY